MELFHHAAEPLNSYIMAEVVDWSALSSSSNHIEAFFFTLSSQFLNNTYCLLEEGFKFEKKTMPKL